MGEEVVKADTTIAFKMLRIVDNCRQIGLAYIRLLVSMDELNQWTCSIEFLFSPHTSQCLLCLEMYPSLF